MSKESLIKNNYKPAMCCKNCRFSNKGIIDYQSVSVCNKYNILVINTHVCNKYKHIKND